MGFSAEQLKEQQAYKGARTTDPKKLSMLVRIHNVDPEVFHPDRAVRAALAVSTSDRRTMHKLTLDDDPHVRVSLTKNHNVFVDVLDTMANDPVAAIAAYAIQRINNIPR